MVRRCRPLFLPLVVPAARAVDFPDDWLDLHSGGVPGISNNDVLTFEAAGTQSLRVNILPKKFFRRIIR